MNYTKYIASKAYEIYMRSSKCQLSPDDALWITDQYLVQNPYPSTTIEEAIEVVSRQLIQAE